MLADDLEMLHAWKNQPHLMPFYMRGPVSLADMTEKFTPRIDGRHHCHSFVAECDGRPFGYAQWYLNRDYLGSGIALAERPSGVSIDYFIGDPAFLGRGLGAQMLDALVRDAAPKLAPADRIFHICHDDQNLRAIACTRDAGFIAVKPFTETGKACTLFERDER